VLVDKEKVPEIEPPGVSSLTNKRLALASSPEPLDSRQTTDTVDEEKHAYPYQQNGPPTLTSLVADLYRWLQETFPTVTVVVSHMPFPLVPFAFAMFVLVQALVTKGWVPVFAYGWDHWVNRTGTVGAVGGMGFLSVILCNVSSVRYTSTSL
jgi:hypothetical protein